MAHELKPWKQEHCSLAVDMKHLSEREPFSQEINELLGEGGALNANYRTVEAIARATNAFGVRGLIYGVDFVFKTAGLDDAVFDFRDQETRELARQILAPAFIEE
jgi:hypothetical protein